MTFVPAQFHAVAATELIVAIEHAFDFSSAEYHSLQQRSRANAFHAGLWLAALQRDVAPAFGAELAIVTVRDKAESRLLLVLPLVLQRRKGVRFLEFADFGLCDYLGAVYDPTETPQLVSDATLPQRLAAALPFHDVIAFSKLTGDDPLLGCLFPNIWRARMRISAYPTRLWGGWPKWRATVLEKRLRKKLDYQRRRLAKLGPLIFSEVRDSKEIIRVFEALRRFRVDRFKQIGAYDLTADDRIFSFYRNAAIEGARSGLARTCCLYLSGEPIAVAFGLIHQRTFALILLTFDVDRFKKNSLGLLATEDTLRASFEAGETIHDFTIGDHPYKQQFGAEEVPLYEWHQARTIRGHLAVLCVALVREAKRALKLRLKTKPTLWIVVVLNLYFVGLVAANTFGPIMRFLLGGRYAAWRRVRHFAQAMPSRQAE